MKLRRTTCGIASSLPMGLIPTTMPITPPRWMAALAVPPTMPVDNSYALMFYDPALRACLGASASIYQIFPDRFRDGRSNNDPKTNDVRYDDPVLKLPWGTLPEGYCRNYADAAYQLSLEV